MAHDAAAQQSRLYAAILHYIQKNPLAADTADGILSCWVPHDGFENAADHIAAVLGDLVANHWLKMRQLPDGKILYVCVETPDSAPGGPEPGTHPDVPRS